MKADINNYIIYAGSYYLCDAHINIIVKKKKVLTRKLISNVQGITLKGIWSQRICYFC